MKSFVTISFFITVALFLSSCNRHFTKFPMYHSTLRKIPTDKIKQQVVFTKNMVSKIVSISVVCRDNGGEGGSQFIPRAKVIQNEEYDITKLLYNYFAKIKSDGAYPIIYDGSGVNDSIYKSIYNNAFINTYHHQMMQSIDFTNVKQDGIYLVVTYLIQWTSGYGPSISENAGGGGYRSNTLYEFFEVKDGKAMAYTGYSLGREDSFRRSSQKGFPKYRDIKLILKKMYKRGSKAN